MSPVVSAASRTRQTPLLGAWSLDGAAIDEIVPAARRAAAVPEGAARAEHLSGRLWLCAASGRLSSRGGAVAAWEGWLEPRADAWAVLPRLTGRAGGPADGAAGHYVAVWADPTRGELSLMRDPTGGERLYFVERAGALFFGSSAPSVLRLAGLEPALEPDAALERGLTELVHFGDATLWRGLREVLPGHRARVAGGRLTQAWAWDGLLEPPHGDFPALARGLRESLKSDVARVVGGDGRVAVALSGGLDSSAVAALACEILGPANVRAFTVEYAHPDHPSEAPYAEAVCRALKMAPPDVVRIELQDILDCAVAGVGLTEDPRYWKRAYPMRLAQAAAREGYGHFLTGFGIGSHMSYLEEVARAAEMLPWPQAALRAWASARRPFPGAATALSPLHPGLEAPMSRLVYPILAALRARGAIAAPGSFYPPELSGLVERLMASPRVADAGAALASLPLEKHLQFSAFWAMNSCVDVARCERAARAVGATWVGPAHFPSSLPYCYLPTRPLGAPWSMRRRARPGKALVAAAMRGTLPDAIIDRPKYWPHANGPAEWRDASLARMEAAAGRSWDELRALFGPAFDAAKSRCPEGMIPLAFWHRVCVAGAGATTWEELA